MSNYLSQIAARNAVPDQPLMMPAHSPVQARLDDPFDRTSFAADETGNAAISGPVQPVKEHAPDATAPAEPMEIKPVYLSKYIARNQYYSGEQTNTVITKSQGSNEAIHAEVNSPVLSIFPEEKNKPATNGPAHQQLTAPQKIDPVQQKNRIAATRLVPTQQSVESKKTPAVEEQPAAILPVAATTANNNKPVLLQPHLLQPHANLQKEKSVPALVIGKITVEIVPAQKPVNKIINHVVKPQPAASASSQRNKFSFGLGQL